MQVQQDRVEPGQEDAAEAGTEYPGLGHEKSVADQSSGHDAQDDQRIEKTLMVADDDQRPAAVVQPVEAVAADLEGHSGQGDQGADPAAESAVVECFGNAVSQSFRIGPVRCFQFLQECAQFAQNRVLDENGFGKPQPESLFQVLFEFDQGQGIETQVRSGGLRDAGRSGPRHEDRR